MTEWLWNSCAIIGMIAAMSLLMAVIYTMYESLSTVLHNARWSYKYKHRFDKKLTAKCYCKDCYYHSNKDKCVNVTWADRYTPDNGFCYDATPMTAKEAKKREQ